MEDKYVYEDKKTEQQLDSLKARLLDIISVHQDRVAKIEAEIVKQQDKNPQELLVMLGNYHNCLNKTIDLTKGLDSIMMELDSNYKSYLSYFNEEEKAVVTELPKTEVEIPVEEVSDEVVSEVTENGELPEVKEETAKVETPVEETSTEVIPIVEENTELPNEEEVVVSELPKAEVETPVEETSTEVISIVEENNEAPKEEKAIVTELPKAEEESNGLPKVSDTPLVSDITALPTIDGDTKKLTIVKDYVNDDKAILITQNQGVKLRASKTVQKSLLDNKEEEKEEVTTQQQIEEMMNQIPLLYEQGKTSEAEALSEKVSVLSKKIAA